MGNILIRPLKVKEERSPDIHTHESAAELVKREPLISTLISAGVVAIH